MTTFVLAAGLVVLIDQATKAIVLRWCAEGQVAHPSAGWPIRIRRISNPRPGFGLLAAPRLLLATWCAAAAAVVAVAFGAAAPSAMVQGCLGSALGGATSNTLDMLRRGAVVDFIDLRVWPVFNLADVAVVAGGAVAAWALLTAAPLASG
jgi:signal peptidase II